jgi:hypothetical protein
MPTYVYAVYDKSEKKDLLIRTDVAALELVDEHKVFDVYWGLGGPTHWSYSGREFETRFRVLWCYGPLPRRSDYADATTYYDADEAFYDSVSADFNKRFPPRVDWQYTPSEVMISPDGVFYPCHYGGHTEIAERLLKLYYTVEILGGLNYEDELIKRGWVSVRLQIPSLICDKGFTEGQERAVRLMMAHPDLSDKVLKQLVMYFDVNKRL